MFKIFSSKSNRLTEEDSTNSQTLSLSMKTGPGDVIKTGMTEQSSVHEIENFESNENDWKDSEVQNDKNESWTIEVNLNSNTAEEFEEPSVEDLKSSLSPLLLDMITTFTLDEKDLDQIRSAGLHSHIDNLFQDLLFLPHSSECSFFNFVLLGNHDTELVSPVDKEFGRNSIHLKLLPDFLCAIEKYIKDKDHEIAVARLLLNYSFIITSKEGRSRKGRNRKERGDTTSQFLTTILILQQNFDNPAAMCLILRALRNFVVEDREAIRIFGNLGGQKFLCSLIHDAAIPMIRLYAENLLSFM